MSWIAAVVVAVVGAVAGAEECRTDIICFSAAAWIESMVLFPLCLCVHFKQVKLR